MLVEVLLAFAEAGAVITLALAVALTVRWALR